MHENCNQYRTKLHYTGFCILAGIKLKLHHVAMEAHVCKQSATVAKGQWNDSSTQHTRETDCSVLTREVQLFSQCWVCGRHLLLAAHSSIARRRFLVASHLAPGPGHYLLHIHDISRRHCFSQFLTQRLNKPRAACWRIPAVPACITDITLVTGVNAELSSALWCY